ncbi:hypothetical protein BOTBODRAFT_115640, partial [Botryobasidium botryosum FD-172 SS1]
LVTPVIAILFTCFRLFDRYRNRLLGPDDAWAFASMMFIIVFVVTWNLWLVGMPRISIIFCLVRVSPGVGEKRLLHAIVGVFLLFWIFLSAQVIWVCESRPQWKNAVPFPSCSLGNEVAISQLITSLSSDLLLMAWPIRLFWALKSSRGLRIRLMAIFSTCLVTSAANLVHSIFTVKAEGLNQAIAAIVEATVGLIVCNLPIVVGAIYRLSGDSLEAAGGGWGTQVGHVEGTPQTISLMQFSHAVPEVAVELDVGKSASDLAISTDAHDSLRAKAASPVRLANIQTSRRWSQRGTEVSASEVIELSVLSPAKIHDSRSILPHV